MRPLKIALGDLSYFTEGNNHNLYVPLNLGYVASYAKAKFSTDISIELFKNPTEMLGYVRDEKPDLIGMSAYYWQENLNKTFVSKVRQINGGYAPKIVMGGPSIDSDVSEQKLFLQRHEGIDEIVVNEGEEGFSSIINTMLGGESTKIDPNMHPAKVGLSTDLAEVPSPYLDGTLDKFLTGPFQPMMQTSRLCPYTCLAGDTPINTILGDIPIRELSEKYGDAGIPVYTLDTETGEAFIADSVMIRKYGQDKQLVRVHFDDDTYIDCTPDHKFLRFHHSEQWECEARDLTPKAQVRALRLEINEHLQRAYVNWSRRDRKLRARMVMEYELGRKLTRKEHVHHVDRNRLNDLPSNLEHYVSAAEHLKHHPEQAERMRTNNPTKNGMTQEWRDKIAASIKGKVRSYESRLRYRESKLGTKNPNFKDGSNVGKSRIEEVNHKVVRVEYLAEKGDVYCLTVPKTGWFYANNVLVKNCSFCVSGKNRGKLRMFPEEQIKAELAYISRYFQDRKDVLLYLTDENFGIMQRDVQLAAMIREFKDKTGYPQRVFYYNDKRFTQNSRDVQEVLGDMCWHGVMLSLQSENPETLKAIKRRNLTDDDIRSAISWAHNLNLPVSTELIFGLPFETRQSFLALLDKCARLGFDRIQCYNLIVFDGIEMNRRVYRKEHELKTRSRPINAHSMVVDGEVCSEFEEVVISSNTISFDDYCIIRAMNVMFHAVFVNGVKREFFKKLVSEGQSLTGFFTKFLTPTDYEGPEADAHRQFLDDLNKQIHAEIDGSQINEVVKIQPVFAGKIVQHENDWVSVIIDKILNEVQNDVVAA
jgi:radical SAM superfamily enzyme YgiQ (UPF0313 family)